MIKRLIGFLVIAIIAIFFIRIITESFYQIRNFSWKFNYFSLSISFLLLFLYYGLRVVAWSFIIENLGVKPPSCIKLFKIYYITFPAKYIPGKIWTFLGRLYMLSKHNVSEAKAFKSIVWEFLLFLTTGVLLFLFLLFFSKEISGINSVALVCTIVLLIYISFYPSFWFKIIDFLVKKIKKVNYPCDAELTKMAVLKFLIIYLSLWLICGTAFYFFINSIYEMPFTYLFFVICIYPISWIAGTLFFLTPSGLGVSEGVMAGLLSFYFPLPIAVVISILSRIWISVGEVTYFILALRLKLS